MSESLLSRLKGETAKTLIRTFLAKGMSAFGALGLIMIVGQLYGPKGVGVYALAQSILLGAGILSRRGMDNALLRFIGRDYRSLLVRRYLYWAGVRSLFVSVPLSLAIFLLRDWFESFFEMSGLSDVLLGVALAVPFYTWSFLLAGFFKGIRKPAMASFQESGAIALVAGVLLLLLHALSKTSPLDFSVLGWVYLIAAILIAAQGHLIAFFWLGRYIPAGRSTEIGLEELAELRDASLSFFIMGMAGFMQSVLGIMIAAKFLSSVELGLFKSAQQVAISVLFVLMVINAIFPPRFAALYHAGNLGELSRAARSAALLGLLLSSPFLVVCLLTPELILALLGKGFESAAIFLRILAVAQLVNVATGSVGFLLNMTGHDQIMRKIALYCNGVALAGFLFLSPLLGALGATLSLAFALVAQNILAMVTVWIKLGIWTMPGPNLLKHLGVHTKAKN
ncbi:hypothetical protein [uncultured Alcanivorax sp.]|jgi:O-antigen/teichoic acid export membrane protein|uniref:lipopolysaccharide biosynthesis protein n=1 Tax=uncultured Alcanivorax sp. TaxID=191215 RepID=UPI0025874982|nr:hypothetical protein [uncultured Alcanivorax sp.]